MGTASKRIIVLGGIAIAGALIGSAIFGGNSGSEARSISSRFAQNPNNGQFTDAENTLFRLASFEPQLAHAREVTPTDQTTSLAARDTLLPPPTSAPDDAPPPVSDQPANGVNDKLIEQIARYRLENSQLRSSLEQVTTERDAVKSALLETATKAKAGSDEFAKLQGKVRDIDGLTEENRTLRAELTVLRKVKEEHEKLLTTSDTLKQQNDKLVEEVAKLRSDASRVQSLSDQSNRLSAQLDQARADLQNREQEKAAVIATAADLKRQLQDATAKITSLETSGKQSDSKLTALSQEKSALADKVQAAEQLKKDFDKSVTGLRELKDRKDAVETELTSVKKELETLKQQQDVLKTELDLRSTDLNKQTEELENTKSQLTAAQDQVGKLQADLERGTVERLQLADAVKSAKQESAEQAKQVASLKNDLLMKETELRVLNANPTSAQVAAQGSGTNFGKVDDVPVRRPSPYGSLNQPTPIQQPAGFQQPTSQPSDIMVVTVTAPKVNLRSGPGDEHSPVMQVRAGARLTVEAVQGDWYRVFTPTGSRAYVKRDVVETQPAPLPVGKVVAIDGQPVDPNSPTLGNQGGDVDEKAFDEIKKALGVK